MYHPSWPLEAQLCFEKCVEAHGGWKNWQQFSSYHFRVKSLYGFLLLAKGQYRRFNAPEHVEVFPHLKKVIFHYAEHSDSYEDGRLTLGATNETVPDGRQLFTASLFEQWSPAHVMYFFGNALTNYTSYPFILPQFEFKKMTKLPHTTLYEINFGSQHRTHSPQQVFYFNKENLLDRHDYRAQLAGPWVFGAHHTDQYMKHKGLMISNQRKVYPRIFGFKLPLYGIYGSFELINSLES